MRRWCYKEVGGREVGGDGGRRQKLPWRWLHNFHGFLFDGITVFDVFTFDVVLIINHEHISVWGLGHSVGKNRHFGIVGKVHLVANASIILEK